MKLFKYILVISIFLPVKPVYSGVFDIQFSGIMNDNVYFYRQGGSGSFNNSFVPSQYELVSNNNIGLSYDFTFRFDTDTPFETANRFPTFAGGRDFEIVNASYNGIDFSGYDSQVVQFGTDSNGVDTINFMLYRDVDEAENLRGAWGSQIQFSISDADGDLIPALSNINTQGFSSSIDFVETHSFFINRNRNGLFTGQQYGTVEGASITAYPQSISAVPEPSTIALMIGGLGMVGFVASRRKL